MNPRIKQAVDKAFQDLLHYGGDTKDYLTYFFEHLGIKSARREARRVAGVIRELDEDFLAREPDPNRWDEAEVLARQVEVLRAQGGKIGRLLDNLAALEA